MQALGQSKEAFVLSAQVQSKNAYKASQQAAFLAFQSGLAADQALFEAQTIRTILRLHHVLRISMEYIEQPS